MSEKPLAGRTHSLKFRTIMPLSHDILIRDILLKASRLLFNLEAMS
jgi:hypothetical protein